MSQKKIFFLDGMALIYRAFFAFISNPRITSKGLNTSAVFGLTNTIYDIINNEKPTHLVAVFDTSAPTERHDIFPEYKANREEMPEDLRTSIPYVFQLFDALNIPVITKDGYEADDIIGTLAKVAKSNGFEVFMMTPDKDFAQIVEDGIYLYRPARNGGKAEVLGVPEVKEKFSVQYPEQVIDLLALMGDKVDNIPGIVGVGPKTAKKMLKDYGSVEGLYENVDDIKGKLKEKIIESKENAFLSKVLARINLNVPVPFEPEKYIIEEPNKEKVKQLFQELEFKTLMQKVLGEETRTTGKQTSLFDAPSNNTQVQNNETQEPEQYQQDKKEYISIQGKDQLQNLVKEFLKAHTFAFDTETTSLEPIDARLLGISLSKEKDKAYYISMPQEKNEVVEYLEILKPLLTDKTKLKIAHNLKYDYRVLLQYNFQIEMPVFDTMIAHYLLHPDDRHSLDKLSEKYLNYKPISIESLIGKKGKNQLSFESVPLDKATVYACEDADLTFQLYKALENEKMSLDVKEIFEKMELPLLFTLADMEETGVLIDSEFLKTYSRELQDEILNLEKEIYQLAEIKFNIASPKQLGEVLFDKLKIDDKAKKTKTGQYKTDEETLAKLAHIHPLPEKVLDYRELKKLKSTYVDALPKMVNPKTNKIHTNFGQTIAATGRLSSNNPNLQNIPIRTEKGKHIRKAFVPSENGELLSADYSQVELRVMASMSEDEAMIDAFQNNLDIHTATASKVFGVPLNEVSKDMRRSAKTVNFGIIYGISAFGLSQRINISRTEAKEIIDNYFIQFPGIKTYMDTQLNLCRKKGYVETLLGRRRYIRDINSNNATVRGFAERNAINAPVQGSAADLIKLAMISIHQKMKEQNFQSKMILQVHDELLFDVVLEEKDNLAQLVCREMESAMTLKVPLKVDYSFGKNWLEAH